MERCWLTHRLYVLYRESQEEVNPPRPSALNLILSHDAFGPLPDFFSLVRSFSRSVSGCVKSSASIPHVLYSMYRPETGSCLTCWPCSLRILTTLQVKAHNLKLLQQSKIVWMYEAVIPTCALVSQPFSNIWSKLEQTNDHWNHHCCFLIIFLRPTNFFSSSKQETLEIKLGLPDWSLHVTSLLVFVWRKPTLTSASPYWRSNSPCNSLIITSANKLPANSSGSAGYSSDSLRWGISKAYLFSFPWLLFAPFPCGTAKADFMPWFPP